MKRIIVSIATVLGITLAGEAQTITFSAKNTAPGVIQVYGTYDGATPYTFTSGITSFSMSFEYPRSQANGRSNFANAGAVTAWNNTVKASVSYNTTYFTGSSSAGTIGDNNGGTPGTTYTVLNNSNYVSTNVATSGLKSIPGVDFPTNTPVLLATITLPTGIDVSSVTMKDWANNKAYGGGSPLYAWSMSFDGASVENAAAIFAQTSTTNPPVNGGAANVTSSLGFTGNPLPVTLVSFIARKADESRTQLNWQTSREQGTDYFDVERSGDGKAFNTLVRRMPASGNSSTVLNYQTYDNEPVKGINYYRLKMVDKNGKTAYSSVQVVRFDGTQTHYSLTPNPATDQVTVRGLTAGDQINIASVTGQILSTMRAEAGSQMVNVQQLTPGTYYVQIVHEGTAVSNQKLVKL